MMTAAVATDTSSMLCCSCGLSLTNVPLPVALVITTQQGEVQEGEMDNSLMPRGNIDLVQNAIGETALSYDALTSRAGSNPDDSSVLGEEDRAWVPVTSLRPVDVLLGRGCGPNEYEGNVAFRSLVRERKAEYMATGNRATKEKIARDIVNCVLARNGRFLKKVNDAAEAAELGVPEGVDAWCPVDDKRMMEKAKQALRQRDRQDDDSPSSDILKLDTVRLQLMKPGSPKECSRNACPQESNDVEQDDIDPEKFLLNTLADSLKDCYLDESEQKDLTEEEQQAVMADLFGKMCAIAPQTQTKRLKMEWNSSYVPGLTGTQALIQQMKLEIDHMPNSQKAALMEALRKAPAREISNERLELFLTREDMDPKRAAHRLVTYWEERRKWFGSDKFCLPMTLDGAMRDDQGALLTGFPRRALPPGLEDLSGRQILLTMEFECFNTDARVIYPADSMIRTFFYIHEVAAQHPNAAKGYIRIYSFKGATAWDLDGNLYRGYMHLIKDAFPVSARATHLVGLSPAMLKILRVAIRSWNREFRSRTVLHDVPESQLVEALAQYGIPKEVIPVELGGTYEHDHSKWLAKRRAIEKELFGSNA